MTRKLSAENVKRRDLKLFFPLNLCCQLYTLQRVRVSKHVTPRETVNQVYCVRNGIHDLQIDIIYPVAPQTISRERVQHIYPLDSKPIRVSGVNGEI